MQANAQNNPLANLKREYFTLLAKESSAENPDLSRQIDVLDRAIRIESSLPVPQKDLKLFGITGKMKHGKDTFFSFVQENCPGAVRVAFADALKLEVAKACGVTVDFINENKDRFRTILQWWGTEFRRGLHGDDYWLRRMEDTLRLLPDGTTVFVTDVRFLNEAEFVSQMGGHVVRVTRIMDAQPVTGITGHASEMEQEKIMPNSILISSSLTELQSLTKNWCVNYL